MFFNNPFSNFNEFSPSPRTHYANNVLDIYIG